MDPLNFGIEVIAVSAGGVLAPGPLFFANLLYGTQDGARSGLRMAYGHTIVELPLVILLALGIFSMRGLTSSYLTIIGLLGGICMLYFSATQIIGAVRISKPSTQNGNILLHFKSSFAAGITLSALNPFFLIWWLTIGLKMITDSSTFGFLIGIGVLFGFHIWMDYAWLIITAYLSSKGRFLVKSTYYRILIIALSMLIIYYGINFIFHAIVIPS